MLLDYTFCHSSKCGLGLVEIFNYQHEWFTENGDHCGNVSPTRLQLGAYPRTSMSKRTSSLSSPVQWSVNRDPGGPAGVRLQWVYSCGWGWNGLHITLFFFFNLCFWEDECLTYSWSHHLWHCLLTIHWSGAWSIPCPKNHQHLKQRPQAREGVGRGAGGIDISCFWDARDSLFNKTYSFEPLTLYSFSYHWTTS